MGGRGGDGANLRLLARGRRRRGIRPCHRQRGAAADGRRQPFGTDPQGALACGRLPEEPRPGGDRLEEKQAVGNGATCGAQHLRPVRLAGRQPLRLCCLRLGPESWRAVRTRARASRSGAERSPPADRQWAVDAAQRGFFCHVARRPAAAVLHVQRRQHILLGHVRFRRRHLHVPATGPQYESGHGARCGEIVWPLLDDGKLRFLPRPGGAGCGTFAVRPVAVHPALDLAASRQCSQLVLQTFSAAKAIKTIDLPDAPDAIAAALQHDAAAEATVQYDLAGKRVFCGFASKAYVVDLASLAATIPPRLEIDVPGRLSAGVGQTVRVPLRSGAAAGEAQPAWTLASAPPFAKLEGSDLVLSPRFAHLGRHDLVVKASQGDLSDSATLSIRVEIPSVNVGLTIRDLAIDRQEKCAVVWGGQEPGAGASGGPSNPFAWGGPTMGSRDDAPMDLRLSISIRAGWSPRTRCPAAFASWLWTTSTCTWYRRTPTSSIGSIAESEQESPRFPGRDAPAAGGHAGQAGSHPSSGSRRVSAAHV